MELRHPPQWHHLHFLKNVCANAGYHCLAGKYFCAYPRSHVKHGAKTWMSGRLWSTLTLNFFGALLARPIQTLGKQTAEPTDSEIDVARGSLPSRTRPPSEWVIWWPSTMQGIQYPPRIATHPTGHPLMSRRLTVCSVFAFKVFLIELLQIVCKSISLAPRLPTVPTISIPPSVQFGSVSRLNNCFLSCLWCGGSMLQWCGLCGHADIQIFRYSQPVSTWHWVMVLTAAKGNERAESPELLARPEFQFLSRGALLILLGTEAQLQQQIK